MASSEFLRSTGNVRQIQCGEVVPPPERDEKGINCLPEEILLVIFGYLPINSLNEASRVCRRWKGLVADSSLLPLGIYLRVHHPELPIRCIDERFWEKYGHHFDITPEDAKAPPQDRAEIVEAAKKMLAAVPVEGNAGITVLLEPKGLSFCNLIKNSSFFQYVDPKVVCLMGNNLAEETRWLGLTSGIVAGTECMTAREHKEYLYNRGCELASVRTLCLLEMATFWQSAEKGKPTRLFDETSSSSRCAEFTGGSTDAHVCFGGFEGRIANSRENERDLYSGSNYLPAGASVSILTKDRYWSVGACALRKI